MKFVSKAALGLVLTLGPVAMIAVPGEAQAQKKPKNGEAAAPAAPSGPQLKLSKGFRAAALPIDTAYKASDWRGVLTAADAAEAAATSNDDKYQLNQWRLSAGANLKDVPTQTRAIDALIGTNLIPAADRGKYHFFKGKFAMDGGDVATANAAFDAAEAAGYTSADFYLTRSRLYSNQKNYAQSLVVLEKAMAAERAAGRPVPEDWFRFAMGEASRGKLSTDLAKWSTLHLKAFPSAQNWRSALVNYRDNARLGPKAELDLYRLMRASKALAGEKDHYDYAYIANSGGLPGEAKTVLDLYKSTGGTVTGRAIPELNTEVSARVSADKASLVADEKRAAGAANGTLAASTGNAYLGYGDYAKAASLLQTALSKGGVDNDEVNTRLGIALAMQGQKDAARTAFAQVKGPRAGVAQYWITYLDQPMA